jgi:biotin/methionine sulfoxide reductase
VAPLYEARNDFDIFADLAERFGVRQAYTEGRDLMGWTRHLYEHASRDATQQGVQLPPFEEFWNRGYVEIEAPGTSYVALQDFRDDPVANRLATPSGKIELYCEKIAGFGYSDCPGHATWLAPREWLGAALAEAFPLHLITSQPATRLHSQLDGVGISAAEKIHGREPVWMHPQDAQARHLHEGDIVRLHNDRGACLAGLHITADVMPGVIRIATGAWYDPDRPGEVGALDKHGNPNVLTRDAGTSRLAQGPTAMSTLVEVSRAVDPPPVTAHLPPVILKLEGAS